MTIPYALIISFFAAAHVYGQLTIAFQPLGEFDSTLFPVVIARINEVYPKCSVEVLPTAALPEKAYYKPRNRYRAEKLLMYLDSIKPQSATKIVGFTVTCIIAVKNFIQFEDPGLD